ncbi:cysteine desulfurase family protein [Planctomycetaceae bacterium SH139]
MQPVYLDFNSTTPLAPSVREAMEPFWTEHFMLPGQGHRGCQAVADALDQAREAVARMVGCEAFEIVFTGGATESNNLAIMGVVQRFERGHLIAAQCEHDSVWLTVDSLRSRGWQVDFVPPDSSGRIVVEEVERLLRKDTKLVCLQAANSISGAMQPVREVADICHSRGVLLHCDAVQIFGKSTLTISDLRADTASISGHKMYAPKGVGALYIRRGLELAPLLSGEIREMGLRPGAENVSGWIGLGAAARLAERAAKDAVPRFEALRERFVERLSGQVDGPVCVLGGNVERLSNTLLLQLPREAMRVARSARQIIAAVASGTMPADEMSRALLSMGLTPQAMRHCCRISLGLTTSEEQLDRAADALAEACEIG